jgi:hypothetical protein
LISSGNAGIGFQLAAQAQDLDVDTAIVDLVLVIRLCPPQDGPDAGLVWPVVHPPTDATTARPAINTTILQFTSLCSRNGFSTGTVDFISWASQVEPLTSVNETRVNISLRTWNLCRETCFSCNRIPSLLKSLRSTASRYFSQRTSANIRLPRESVRGQAMRNRRSE